MLNQYGAALKLGVESSSVCAQTHCQGCAFREGIVVAPTFSRTRSISEHSGAKVYICHLKSNGLSSLVQASDHGTCETRRNANQIERQKKHCDL